jgi:hypothetical protein
LATLLGDPGVGLIAVELGVDLLAQIVLGLLMLTREADLGFLEQVMRDVQQVVGG